MTRKLLATYQEALLHALSSGAASDAASRGDIAPLRAKLRELMPAELRSFIDAIDARSLIVAAELVGRWSEGQKGDAPSGDEAARRTRAIED